MSQRPLKLEAMLFDYGTTNKTDYRDGEIKPQIKTVYKHKPERKRLPTPPGNFVHTMMPWRAPMPFDAFIKPNDITRNNPHVVQKKFTSPHDTKRLEVQKTRPRLVMTPALSMDDMEEPARSILINEMYTTDMTQKMEEAISPTVSIKAPLPGHPAPANPMALRPLKPPYVSPEWRMETLSWDRKQLRSYCDSTRDFWLRPKK
ncbi:uncharacterized protein LOC113236848 [Hyposmocoma kahamanoa]|uniref:uncharacterized protein LOC113236848 n=1 Tax=Hyposmocoma kahamanoa TaxID=1477025 RepID=UPI000E6D92DE|nr:uncharacterized protein LOC113236848 [Hyposmocoma kahamanoa]